jgi:hypothetical protein
VRISDLQFEVENMSKKNFLPQISAVDKISSCKRKREEESGQPIGKSFRDTYWPGRLMLWRETKFSFSAKSGRSHPFQSDLEDDGTEEAESARTLAALTAREKSALRIFFHGLFPLTIGTGLYPATAES